jgi:hypothetical protein
MLKHSWVKPDRTTRIQLRKVFYGYWWCKRCGLERHQSAVYGHDKIFPKIYYRFKTVWFWSRRVPPCRG